MPNEGSMGKKVNYTKITPLPSNIPRQLALDMLHSHTEVIELNPLVTGVKPISAPRDAAADEFFSNWYEISEIITWGFGIKKKIAFKGVFHDQPWGLQSHVYAPMGTDLRNNYRIGGNQPGEPREARELGMDTPKDGLYLREDVEIICAVPLTAGFVKKEMKAATGTMIDRMTRKAELLEEGKLHAMFENGKLKTARPSMGPTQVERPEPSPTVSDRVPASPALSSVGSFVAPGADEKGFGRYSDIVGRQTSQRSFSGNQIYQQGGYAGSFSRPGDINRLTNVPEVYEAPGSYYHPQYSPNMYGPGQQLKPPQGGQVFRAELPGDTYLPQQSQPQQDPRASQISHISQLQQPPSQHQSQQYQPYNTSPMPSPGMPPPRPSSESPNPNTHIRHSSHHSMTAEINQHPAHRASLGANSASGVAREPSPKPASQTHSPQSVAEWQRNLSVASSSDPNSMLNSRRTSMADPDHERFSNMSVQQSPTTSYSSNGAATIERGAERGAATEKGHNGGPTGGVGSVGHAGAGAPQVPPRASMKCPVCGLFEGDEAAVSHHVNRQHFS